MTSGSPDPQRTDARAHIRSFVIKTALSVLIAIVWSRHGAMLAFSLSTGLYAVIAAAQAMFRRQPVFIRSVTYWDEAMWLTFGSLCAFFLRGTGN